MSNTNKSSSNNNNRTEAQREASRANGSLSHGPKTEQGKANSSRNALRHGLRAKTLVLANEAPEVLEALCAEYEAEHQPETATERDLVTEMAFAKWRQYRTWISETATLNKEMAETKPIMDLHYEDYDESIRTAVAVESALDRGRALDIYNRIETRCNRQFHRALSMLLALQKARKANRDRLCDTPDNPTYIEADPVVRESIKRK